MKKYLLSLLVFVILPWLSLANGDPVISFSASIRSCNPVPLKVSDVQVVREDLNIKVMVPYTEVSVAYRLRNGSSRDIHVDYGFPLDFSGNMDDLEGFDSSEMSESMFETGIADRALRDIHFRLEGKELGWTHADSIVKIDEYENEEGEMVDMNVCRLWTYTVLDIPAGATVTLEVNYSVLCNWSAPLFSLGGSPLTRYFPHDGEFYYDFTPARHWGNGKADVLSLKVDCSGLPKGFLHKESPESPSVYGADFVRNGNVFTYDAKNYDFATANGLVVDFYRNYSVAEEPFPSWGEPLKNCLVSSSKYRLNVSGSQDKYPASNMQDGDLTTAWVAPGNGVGATISIDFPTPCRVSDIGLYNGYHKSASLWSANSRIKRMRLEITRADGYKDEPLELELTEWDGNHFALSEADSPRFGSIVMIPVTTLFREQDGRQKGEDENGIILFDKVPFSSEYVSSIRMTVLEVEPGTKYKDLCLSDLLILDGFKMLPE